MGESMHCVGINLPFDRDQQLKVTLHFDAVCSHCRVRFCSNAVFVVGNGMSYSSIDRYITLKSDSDNMLSHFQFLPSAFYYLFILDQPFSWYGAYMSSSLAARGLRVVALCQDDLIIFRCNHGHIEWLMFCCGAFLDFAEWASDESPVR